ncbi:MAG: 2-amino-4-hydroxy-6-hydroxymethyldihydropteridine diphosphokinase [Muribaculaceae bacterium]|nr:2-amino-4-hydroxy-6-hydroxymethyldihydropteridine diphosphokinase [Muribaculaceae bacterium]
MSQDESMEANDAIASLAIFSIGSNCGNRHANVSEGLKWLSMHLMDFRSSSIYATPDCHGGVKEYFNAVAIGTTNESPENLEQLCKQYELSCGRNDEMRKSGNVPIDIDLVVYGDKVIRPNDFKREFFRIGYEMI